MSISSLCRGLSSSCFDLTYAGTLLADSNVCVSYFNIHFFVQVIRNQTSPGTKKALYSPALLMAKSPPNSRKHDPTHSQPFLITKRWQQKSLFKPNSWSICPTTCRSYHPKIPLLLYRSGVAPSLIFERNIQLKTTIGIDVQFGFRLSIDLTREPNEQQSSALLHCLTTWHQ